MRQWFDNLAPREQWMVGAAAVILALMLYFLLLWEPLLKQSQRLDKDLSQARDLVAYMHQVEAEAKTLGGQSRGAPRSSGRSLLAEVDSSSKRSGLGPSIKRIQPEDQTRVRLWLEDARFEVLMNWLYQLQSAQGIVLENGSFDRDSNAGTVKARLTLIRSGA